MIIDLTKCIGCESCVITCKNFYKIPKNKWRRIIDCGDYPFSKRQRLLIHQTCMHCYNPSCIQVCPTKATYQRKDGIVAIDYNKCIACGSCIVACPYNSRHILNEENLLSGDIINIEEIKGRVKDEKIKVCSKCNFCFHRIDSGAKKGLTPGKDEDATPLCVNACSSGALFFGDFNTIKTDLRDREKNKCKLFDSRTITTETSIFVIYPEWWS